MENKLNRKKIKHRRKDIEWGLAPCWRVQSCQRVVKMDVVEEASQKDERCGESAQCQSQKFGKQEFC